MPKGSTASAAATAPSYANSFVGRDADLAALEETFESGARLVSIVGPPGIGKTRLSARFAAAHPPAVFCDLSATRSEDEVVAALARALGVALDDVRIEGVAHALAARGPTLVVLDNFEQVVESAAASVSALVGIADRARAIVTTRERLRVAGEVVFELEPLGDADAVHLFVERASAVRRGWSPSPADLDAVREIVRRLDRLPLAIELAAARARAMTPRQILDRLGLPLLALGGRDASERQATLEGAIDGSYRLLRPYEQAALSQCSVFRGSVSLEAAEAVLALGANAPSAPEVLASLQDKSLLRAFEPRDLPGELRFAAYESVRAFAEARLRASGEQEATRDRHAAWFASVVERLSSSGDEGRKRLLLELDDIAAAQELLLARGDGARALALTVAIEPIVAGLWPADRIVATLRASLDAATEAPSSLVVSAHLAIGQAELRRGKADVAHAAFARALEVADDDRARARAHRALGAWSFARGHLGEAIAPFERALELARATSDAALQARIHDDLGNVERLRGNLPEARAHYEASLRLAARADPAFERIVRTDLARLAHRQGLLDEALRAYQTLLAAHRAAADRQLEAGTLLDVGYIAHERGDRDESRRRFEEALALFRAIGSSRSEGFAHGLLGIHHEETGNLDEARRSYEQAIAIHRGAGNALLEGLDLANLGRVEATAGNVEAARVALDEATRVLSASGDALHLEAVALCRGHLELLLARIAEADGRKDEAAALRAQARERASTARAATHAPIDAGGRKSSLAERSEDVRVALRLLDRALATVDAPKAPSLAVSRDGRWFKTPEGERTSIDTRGALRKILAALAEQREKHPGQALSVEALFSAGWPGERAHPSAATSRVYVAVSTLRRMGLRAFLQRRDDGYLLDPETPFARG